MNIHEHSPARVVVLGGGIAGLTAAYELLKRTRDWPRRPEIVLLESSPRLGGKVISETRDGLTYEGGPDSFITAKPQVLELAAELGLSGELLATGSSQALWMLRGGKLRRLPRGMGFGAPTNLLSFLCSGFMTWGGKLRVAAEPFIAPLMDDRDESLGAFLRRRLGQEAFERAAGPILAGIYAGDPDRLSLRSTFPQFHDMEHNRGLLLGARAAKPLPPGRSFFMTLRGGLSRLTDALAGKLEGATLRKDCAATGLLRRGRGWTVRTTAETFEASAVVSALPAHALADICGDLDFELSGVLREIPFVSTAAVSLAYDAAGFPADVDGFGFVAPRAEGKAITAATFSSSKFPGRAPAGKVLIRCFIGRDGGEEAAEWSESKLARVAREELSGILGLKGIEPLEVRVQRWPKANPQYIVGHGLRLKRIDSCLLAHPGLALAGSSYRGVGLPDCIASGRRAAAQVLETLKAGGASRSSAREVSHGR